MVFQVLRGKSWKKCLSKHQRASRVIFLAFLVDFGSILEAEIYEKPRKNAPRKTVDFYLRFFGNFGRSWGAFSPPLDSCLRSAARAARIDAAGQS